MAQPTRWVTACVLCTLAAPCQAGFDWSRLIHKDNVTQEIDPFLSERWTSLLGGIWSQAKGHVAFCLGDSEAGVLALARQSFPMPLPTGPADDPVCSNRTAISLGLCGFKEVMEYYKYMLRTENLEKVPNTPQCPTGLSGGACAPGFFNANGTGAGPALPGVEEAPHACCEGYFCPPMLACLIPCPLGAHCPRAWPLGPPDAFIEELKPLPADQNNMWCAPYAYKLRAPLGCGGADKWDVLPKGAFDGFNWGGSGNIFCDGGWYCPNVTTKLQCPAGHYCKQGSTEPKRCPPLMKCPLGSEVPTDNYTGVLIDILLFIGLWLVWHISRWYNALIRRLNLKERLRITVGPYAGPPKLPSNAFQLCMELQDQAGHLKTDEETRSLPESTPAVVAAGAAPAGGSQAPAAPLVRQTSAPEVPQGAFARILSTVSGKPAALHRRGSKRLSMNGSAPAPWASFGGPLDMYGEYDTLPEGPSEDGTGHISMSVASGFSEDHEASGLQRMLVGSPMNSPNGRPGKRACLDVQFRNMSLRLKAGGKRVLANVTGKLTAGHLTAIMGPSGAGKTTLMNTLAGKASYGEMSGVILVNGRPDRLERYKRVTGFVPQDDIMHANLTVEENMMFSARMRLPHDFTHSQHLYYVDRAIQVLQLDDVRHELIGDEETRGISGGQRKRVNVGLELVADPLLLFLDEPTSGLDSTSSKLVVAALKQVAQLGVTVTAVIHQPSYEIFGMFDDLLMLAKGGRTVYYGPEARVLSYFEEQGFQVPDKANPADAFMDMIAGMILPKGTTGPADLPALWEAHCEGADAFPPSPRRCDSVSEDGVSVSEELAMTLTGRQLDLTTTEPSRWQSAKATGAWLALVLGAFAREKLRIARQHVSTVARQLATSVARRAARLHPFRRASEPLLGALRSSTGGPAGPSGGDCPDCVRKRITPGFRKQFGWCLSRAILQRTREPLTVFTDYAIWALTGSALGSITDRGRGNIMHFDVDTIYNIVALGLLATVSALRTFGQSRVIFFREASSGLHKLAYFLALELFDSVALWARAAVYLVMYYSFAQPRAVMWQFYLVTVALLYACTGTGYFMSQIMEPAASQLSAAIYALLAAISAKRSDSTGVMRLVYNMSFAHWGLEGYIIAEANKLTGVWLLARCADLGGLAYSVTDFRRCLLWLGAIGLIFRGAALACLHLMHRDKQR